MRNPRVLVSHPQRQHSHQAALALDRYAMLGAYWTGVPCLRDHQGMVPDWIWKKFVRYAPIPIKEETVRWLPITPVVHKISRFCLPFPWAKYFEYVGFHWFDRWTAGWLKDELFDIVVAYENSALETFRAAKKKGMKTVLDAAAFCDSPDLQTYEPKWLHRRVIQRKAAEIKLADHVLTVSELARQSYLKAGLAEDRVHTCRLGVDLDLFRIPSAGTVKDRVFVFLFCGNLIFRKGVDTLIEAFKTVQKDCPPVILRFIGSPGDAFTLVKKALCDLVVFEKPTGQAGLVREYQNADCLVLPSRHDSFGMVVAEALACGLPVIVTEGVGAKDLVTNGRNGWVIPCENTPALVEKMMWCVENKAILRNSRPQIRETVAGNSWKKYGERFVSLIKEIDADDKKRL